MGALIHWVLAWSLALLIKPVAIDKCFNFCKMLIPLHKIIGWSQRYPEKFQPSELRIARSYVSCIGQCCLGILLSVHAFLWLCVCVVVRVAYTLVQEQVAWRGSSWCLFYRLEISSVCFCSHGDHRKVVSVSHLNCLDLAREWDFSNCVIRDLRGVERASDL